MCWKLKSASSQIVYFGSWLVHSLAPFGDPWQMKQGAITSLSCFSTQPPFADTQEAPSSAEKHLYTVFQEEAFPGWVDSLLGTVLHSFPSLCRTDGVHFQTLCLLPLEEAGESCNKDTGRQLPVLHPPHSLIPSLILISFLPGSINLSEVGSSLVSQYLSLLLEICFRKSYPCYDFTCFYQSPGELNCRRWLDDGCW